MGILHAVLADAGQWGWRHILRRILGFWHTSSHSPTSQPFWAALSAPFPSTQAAFLTTYLQALGVPSPPKSPLALISLHSPGVSSSCGFIRSYLGSHKPQMCEKWAHCSPPLLPEHSPSCSGIPSMCPPMLGKARGDRCCAFGKLAALSIRILWEFMLKSLLICKNQLHTHLMYGSSINSAWPGPSPARTFPFAACWVWQVLSCSHFQSIALSCYEDWISLPSGTRQSSFDTAAAAQPGQKVKTGLTEVAVGLVKLKAATACLRALGGRDNL